mgnify:FL=1
MESILSQALDEPVGKTASTSCETTTGGRFDRHDLAMADRLAMISSHPDFVGIFDLVDEFLRIERFGDVPVSPVACGLSHFLFL